VATHLENRYEALGFMVWLTNRKGARVKKQEEQSCSLIRLEEPANWLQVHRFNDVFWQRGQIKNLRNWQIPEVG